MIHGGTQIDTALDPTSRDMDFKLLHDAFEAVINSHYRGAVGKIALRLVECPAICSKALNLLSQLCTYSESDSGEDFNGDVLYNILHSFFALCKSSTHNKSIVKQTCDKVKKMVIFTVQKVPFKLKEAPFLFCSYERLMFEASAFQNSL